MAVNLNLDPDLLSILVCPKCRSEFRVDDEANELVCTNATCALAYPVRDDIPVLLIDEARETQAEDELRERMSSFDDSRLDDPAALEATDHLLRRLAGAGARVRAEIDASEEALSKLGYRRLPPAGDRRRRTGRPAGPGRARAGLPGAVRGLARSWPAGLDRSARPGDRARRHGRATPAAMSAASEAVRRGCGLMVASPENSPVAQASAGSRHAIRLPSQSDDQLAAAVAVLQGLHQLELGPAVDAKAVAAMLDDVAIECSPNNDVASNPAKDLSLMLADALPLVWGGSVLAARAARRVVEAMRLASGRPALAADAGHLLPVLANQPPRDVFADPFDQPEELRPGLVILDDGVDDPGVDGDTAASWRRRPSATTSGCTW